ncbi:MAG: hypothetical protein RL308_3248, partial [Bacteroidota bacterium]
MVQKSLEQKIDRVLYILENDDKTSRKGLVKQVEDMEQALDEIILN